MPPSAEARIALRSVARSPGDLRARLASLADLRPNFAPAALSEIASDPWHVDDYCRELPHEPAGEPVEGGSFEAASELIAAYEFADRSRVRAFYEPHAPLDGRNMLLEIRYFAFKVPVGVRVSEIFDERRTVDGRQARIRGWAYQTLEGHIERGQMDYQAWKWLDSGQVQFRIHAVSQIADIEGLALRLGFRLIGRHQQIRFARRCGANMERLVAERLQSANHGGAGGRRCAA